MEAQSLAIFLFPHLRGHFWQNPRICFSFLPDCTSRRCSTCKSLSNGSSHQTKRNTQKRQGNWNHTKEKKRAKHVEEGNDDCGDDISRPDPDATLRSQDNVVENDSDDSDSELFLTVPAVVSDGNADFGAIVNHKSSFWCCFEAF